MSALARGQASSCVNPQLDIYTSVAGVLTDVFELSFQIFDVSDAAKLLAPVQVYPAILGDRVVVNVGTVCPAVNAGKISTGRFVASWTPDLLEPVGTHRIRWFFKLTASSPETVATEDFDVLVEVLASSGQTGYALISDLRDEGVTLAQASDARLLVLIKRATAFIDKVTGQWFEPRAATYMLEGTGSPTLYLRVPIIALGDVLVGDELVLSDEFRIYNRHISQGLLAPDDRQNPRLEFGTSGWGSSVIWDNPSWQSRRGWGPGPQRVSVTGIFGYTDPDPSSPVGVTPELIKRATMLLVIKDLIPLGNMAARIAASQSFGVTSIRTRDQSIDYGRSSIDVYKGGLTYYTGDPEIDAILDLYHCQIVIGVP